MKRRKELQIKEKGWKEEGPGRSKRKKKGKEGKKEKKNVRNLMCYRVQTNFWTLHLSRLCTIRSIKAIQGQELSFFLKMEWPCMLYMPNLGVFLVYHCSCPLLLPDITFVFRNGEPLKHYPFNLDILWSLPYSISTETVPSFEGKQLLVVNGRDSGNVFIMEEQYQNWVHFHSWEV